ncbi:MAG: T9SS type A sorting domain-containing protein [Candidatus Tenebribacter davisii]|nr:T9SS type A sorting domain-containing protein [Candidatus Tenebribacter davisii]
MKKVILIMHFLLMVCTVLVAQAPDTLWTKTFGGIYYENANSVQQTNDGGYVITGRTQSYGLGMHDIWLIKTDENGNEEWNRTFGGNENDEANCVQQTLDSGYIIVGSTNSYGAGSADIWVIKTDSFGNEEWNTTIGGIGPEYGSFIQQTNDEGFIIVGHTNTFGIGNYNIWLIKIDSVGNEEWNRLFDHGTSYGQDYVYCVKQTADEGFIISGNQGTSSGASRKAWLIKTNENGYELWNQTYYEEGYETTGHYVSLIPNGGYIVTGLALETGSSNQDIVLFRTDESGNEIWYQKIDKGEMDNAYSVEVTNNGRFILCGYTNQQSLVDGLVINIDEDGDEMWSIIIGGNPQDWLKSIKQTIDGGYIIAGETYGYGAGAGDFWLVKLGVETGLENNIIANDEFQLRNHPNPFNPNTTIKFSILSESIVNITVFNIKGQKIKSLLNDQISAGEHSIVWNGEDDSGKKISSGVYLYKLNVNGKTEAVKKCLLLK